MSELIIKARREIRTHRQFQPGGDTSHCVRSYRSSPETVHLQLRTHGSWVGVELTFEQAQQLGEHLIAEAALRTTDPVVSNTVALARYDQALGRRRAKHVSRRPAHGSTDDPFNEAPEDTPSLDDHPMAIFHRGEQS